MFKMINLSSQQTQIVMQLLARFSVLSDGRELLAYFHAISLLKNERGGEQVLKEFFKERYDQVCKELEQIGILINKCNSFYLLLDEKQKFDPSDEAFLSFQHAYASIPLYLGTLDEVFIVLIKNSNLRDQSIKRRYFAQAIGQYKTIRIKDKEDEENELVGQEFD